MILFFIWTWRSEISVHFIFIYKFGIYFNSAQTNNIDKSGIPQFYNYIKLHEMYQKKPLCKLLHNTWQIIKDLLKYNIRCNIKATTIFIVNQNVKSFRRSNAGDGHIKLSMAEYRSR